MPPATPQKGGGDASMGPPISSVSRGPPRRSFAPGANVSIFAESPNRGPRKSVAPRMSTMPSAANKLCSNGQIVPNMPVAVSYSEYQAVKAESNRLRLDVERVTERLEDERAHRQKKEDEAITLSKKVHELEQKLAKYARQAGRAERLAKRGEEEKVKGELSLKHALSDAVGDKEEKEERLQQLSRRFEESERALAAARFSEEELTAANETLETRLSAASADVADARKKLEQAEGAREGVRRTLDDYKAEAEAHQKSLTDNVQHLTEELDDLREENAEALAQLAELGTVREGLTSQLEASEAALLAERAASGQARREVESLAPVAERAEALEKTLDEKEEEAAGLTAALAQRDEAAARLKEEVLAARQAATDAAAEGRLRADDVRELQSAKEALEERAEELQREVREAQASAAEARCQDRQQRVESSTEHTRLLKQQEEHKEVIRDQKAKLASQERRAKKLASDAEAAARAMAAKEGELEGLEEKVAELDYQVKVEAHKAKKQQLIADRLREKMEVKEGEIRKLRQSKKALIETANERIDKMNAETKKLENVSNNYRSEYELLAARFTRYRQRKYSAASEYYDAAADGIFSENAATPLKDDAADADADTGADAADASKESAAAADAAAAAAAAGAVSPEASEAREEANRVLPAAISAEVKALPKEQEGAEDEAEAAAAERGASGTPARRSAEPRLSQASLDCLSPSLLAAPAGSGAKKRSLEERQAEALDASSLEDMPFKDVRALAKKLGLKQTGSKKDLIARIEEAQA